MGSKGVAVEYAREPLLGDAGLICEMFNFVEHKGRLGMIQTSQNDIGEPHIGNASREHRG